MTDTYAAGKAHADADAARMAHAHWRDWLARGRPEGCIPALRFVWGTMMAAAQALDPSVNHRRAALNTLKAHGVLD